MLVKNIDTENIDLHYNGITILPDEIIDISESDDELIQLIEMGKLNYVWEDGQELTPVELEKALDVTSATLPDYERFYSRAEIQELVAYSEARTDGKIAELVEIDGDTLSQIQDMLDTDTSVLESLALKSDITHDHPDYSLIHHTHNGYALVNHDHSIYSLTVHNHDTSYAPLNHAHYGYADTNHNHDGVYSPTSHNHDDTYVRLDAEKSVFGDVFKYSKNDDVLTTTSTNDSIHNTLNIDIPETGLYRIGCVYQWNYDDTKTDFIAELEIDGYVVYRHKQEPKDTSGSFGNTGTDQQHSASWFDYISFDSGTSVEINLIYASGSNGKRSSMWNSKLEFWRVE